MDPISREVISSSLLAYADEMTNNFWRTSYSPMNYEVRDYAVGFIDHRGGIITQSRFTHPAFTADLGFVVNAAIDEIGNEGIDDQDVIMSNDPVSQGQHLNNIVVFMPLFLDGELFGFPCVRAHWQDVGGRTIESGATNSTEIFQEGIQFNAIKVHRKGVPNNDVLRMIKHNTRFPDMAIGDLNAQIAACKLGLRRLSELVKRFGRDQVREAIHETWAMSERAARMALNTIPKGEYRAEAFLDDDGVDFNKPVYIKVRVQISDDRMVVDFTETNDQVRGALNSGYFGGASNAARIAFKCLTTPHLPSNEGCFRALEVICPLGKLLNARHPAALGDWSVPFPTVIDTILKALSDAVPDRIPAATRGDPRGVSVAGFDPMKRRFFSVHVPHPGGHGARPMRDGPAPRCAIQQGDEHIIPVEVNETKRPIVIDELHLRQDSGGPGKFRGGLGVEVVFSLVTDGHLGNKMIRSRCLPWGIHGGKPGYGNLVYVIGPDHQEELIGRVSDYPLSARRKVRMLTGGGGGYGDPLERDPEKVMEDVEDGYISLSSAEKDYGVVLDSSGRVDKVETERLRSRIRKERKGDPK